VHNSDPPGNLPNRLEKAGSDFTRQCTESKTALEVGTLSTGVYLRGPGTLCTTPNAVVQGGLTTTRPTNKLKCHKLRLGTACTASNETLILQNPLTPMHLCACANQRRGLFQGFVFWSCPRPNEQAAARSDRCQERDRYHNLSSGSTRSTGSARPIQ
jgi:hypothetical protein